MDHVVVDHLFGEVARVTGEGNIHMVETTHVLPKELAIKATWTRQIIFKTIQDDC